MYFFSTLKIVALATLLGGLSLHAGSFLLPLSQSGEIPAMLPLPYNGPVPFNVLTGKPLTKNSHGKKLNSVLEEAKSSPSKQIFLRIFRNVSTGYLDLSDGTEEQNLAGFNLVTTCHLVFGETHITITPHFEPCAFSSPTHAAAVPYYYPPVQHWYPHPESWYPIAPQHHQTPLRPLNPYTLQQPAHQHYPQSFPQRNFQEPNIHALQRTLRQLHAKLLEMEGQSQEQGSLLQQQLLEKQDLLKKIADLEETLQQRTPSTSRSPFFPSPVMTSLESVNTAEAQPLQPVSLAPSPLARPLENQESASAPIEANVPHAHSAQPISIPTAFPKHPRPRNRARKKDKTTPIQIPVQVKEEKEPDTLAATREQETAKQKCIQEEAERNRLRRAAQETEKATQTAIWQKVESACASKQFSEAFIAIELLNQKTPLYIKGLFAILKALGKANPEESYPKIIKAAQALSKADSMQTKEDRKILIEFLLKHSSTENQEELLKEAADLGNILAATHWHLLQMSKTTKPCSKRNCTHKVALQFFSSQLDNVTLRTHVPRYFAMIQAATQCPHQKDGISIIKTLMTQARSSSLSEADIQTVELRIPDEYKEIAVVTPTPTVSKKATPPTAQEKFELCKTSIVNAIESGDLQAAKDTTVVFIREQKETNTLGKIVTCLAEGLAPVDAQSSVALQLTTLICIGTIINIFRNEIPLDHLETLRQIFEKIPMREAHSSKTRQEKCLVHLQLQLSHILNRFFIQLAYLQTDFHKAKTLTKKKRILDEKLTALLNEAQTPTDAYRIMQSLINYRTSDENGFSRQVETFIGTFIDQHPEKKEIWQRYIVDSQKNFPNRLKSFYEEFEKRQGIVSKAQIIHFKVPKIFEEITTREDAENFIQALNYYSNNDVLSFFGLTVTCIRNSINKTEHTKELWQGLLPPEKASSWCTLL